MTAPTNATGGPSLGDAKDLSVPSRSSVMPPSVPRVVGVLMLVVCAVGVASFLGPDPSSAAGGDEAFNGFGPAPAVNDAGHPLIGELLGPSARVWIYATADGPRYNVATPDGYPLMQDLLADEVYRNFPDLDIGGMFLEPARDGMRGLGSVILMTAEGV